MPIIYNLTDKPNEKDDLFQDLDDLKVFSVITAA